MEERKVVEYKVVADSSMLSLFEKEINKMIKEGWQPLGGMTRDSGTTFFQAMVKYE